MHGVADQDFVEDEILVDTPERRAMIHYGPLGVVSTARFGVQIGDTKRRL